MAKKSKKVSKPKSEPKEALERKISVLESNPEAEVVEVRTEPVTVRVRSLMNFYDLEAKMERGAGAEWEVSKDRAELLNRLGIAIVL